MVDHREVETVSMNYQALTTTYIYIYIHTLTLNESIVIAAYYVANHEPLADHLLSKNYSNHI